MGKLVVVKGDPVSGTDKHNVSGQTSTSPPVAYTGVGDYTYTGSITDALSDFVTIGGVPVALLTSHSSLDPGEDAPPTGGHSGPTGSNLVPAGANPISLSITDSPLGTGVPNAGAGSGVLTVGGVKVLLDADKIDTCSGVPAPGKSTVTASGQSFVTCSE
ncbi:hypothetical protein [Rugosimonospora africana]|uniref:Uncharacterized protein n=1 Tax=Rugosimonospora africana TaxID=556532 RepID=A0A8J3QNG4_9ACTN|nr:hypothetical protein [Rugosimonospora africana]GIH14144.1 hypothetical protein Raf01_23160 [Rugosimonospora africana]